VAGWPRGRSGEARDAARPRRNARLCCMRSAAGRAHAARERAPSWPAANAMRRSMSVVPLPSTPRRAERTAAPAHPRCTRRDGAAAVFPRGTIKRVKVHNFMTYSGTVVIQPGPRLNLVLGPNGARHTRRPAGWRARAMTPGCTCSQPSTPAAAFLMQMHATTRSKRPCRPQQVRASLPSCARCASASAARPRYGGVLQLPGDARCLGTWGTGSV
jgi:hypothetical protein